MSETIHLKPARKGLIVREPGTGTPLPAKGKAVPRSTYWLRRLRDGDVIDIEAEKVAAEAAKSSKRGDK